MKILNADKLHDELDQISSKSATGEWQLIPIRDFRILMGRTEIPNRDMVSRSKLRDALKEEICKSCFYNPEQRYTSSNCMECTLRKLIETAPEALEEGDKE